MHLRLISITSTHATVRGTKVKFVSQKRQGVKFYSDRGTPFSSVFHSDSSERFRTIPNGSEHAQSGFAIDIVTAMTKLNCRIALVTELHAQER